MLNMLLKIIILFIAISCSVLISSHFFSVPYGVENFWDHHGLIFLFFISTLPRLTLLISSVVSGGFIWWLGWFFAPRVLVATLATLTYWRENPLLVVVAWLVAIGGEYSEKHIVVRRSSRAMHNRRSNAPQGEVIDISPIK